MSIKAKDQRGHAHLLLTLVVVVIIAAIGGYVYRQQNKPSKVTSPTVKAKLEQASADLKSINLAGLKSTVDSTNSVTTVVSQHSSSSSSSKK